MAEIGRKGGESRQSASRAAAATDDKSQSRGSGSEQHAKAGPQGGVDSHSGQKADEK
jgi:hypothetical protein